jgi:pimeloyl-ACP methyl ester carboxylesterase
MRVQVSGLATRVAGAPVVVFEAGAASSLEAWQSVVPHLIGTTPFVAYDRAGLGESVWDNQTPTPKHVSGRLRQLLREIGADPPYVLVGHSWGGSLMRFFAGYYPDEIAGIVYVDPGPIITQSPGAEIAPFEAIGAGRAGYDAFWSAYESLLERAPAPVRTEFGVFRSLMQREVAERDLQPEPQVPVVMILAAKPYPALPGLPFDAQQHFAADLRHRIQHLQQWALASPYGTVVVTNHTSHAVPREDPDLIVWAIQRVLSAIGK